MRIFCSALNNMYFYSIVHIIYYIVCMPFTDHFFLSLCSALQQDIAKDQKKENEIETAIGNTSNALGVTTVALIVWAVLITLAIAAIGTLVFRRLRRKQTAWSSAGSVVSDAETGSNVGGMSASSSVVDLSDGHSNAAYERDEAELAAPADVHQSIPDLNKQEDLDFENLGGLYDDGEAPSGDEDGGLASTKEAFGTNNHRRAARTSTQPLQNLFLPDGGSSFM